MRIALVSDTYTPQVNGVTTVVRRIATMLAAAGHDVAVVAPAYPGHRAPTGELRIVSFPCPVYPAIRLSLPRARRVSRFLNDFRADVIHVHTEGPLGVLGRRHALRAGTPLVTSYHTHFPRYAEEYGVPRLAPAVWRWIAWFHAPARFTLTPGHGAAVELRRHGLRDVVVWGAGVDIDAFHPRRRDPIWRVRLGADDTRVVALHVGRLAREKNLEMLVDSWRMARAVFGDRVIYTVAGDGPESRRITRALPFARRVGFLPRPELASLYASADVGFFPSHTETCGLVALEAMASGLPVVVADAGGFTDTVPHGEAGFRVAPRDPHGFLEALADLVVSPERRRAFAIAARRTAERFDAAREDEVLLARYATLVNRQPTETPCAA